MKVSDLFKTMVEFCEDAENSKLSESEIKKLDIIEYQSPFLKQTKDVESFKLTIVPTQDGGYAVLKEPK